MRPLTWAVAVTTVPARRDDLLPQTLRSLAAGGFTRLSLFVDGDCDLLSWKEQFGLDVSVRCPAINAFGSWCLGLRELLIRNPRAERFFMGQDDFLCVRNLRQYLDRSTNLDRAFYNLLTYSFANGGNEEMIAGKGIGWHRGYPLKDGPLGHQKGMGAVALVFSRDAVVTLLSAKTFVEKPLHAGDRAWKAIDGGIVTAMNLAGWHEYVHQPSLVQHMGRASTLGNSPKQQARTFPGENFDAMTLLEGKS